MKGTGLINPQNPLLYSVIKVSMRLSILLMSVLCQGCEEDNAPTKIHSVVVEEKTATIHKLPGTIVHIRDSMIGMRLSPHDYLIFNYYSGEELNRIHIDTLAFRRLISMAKNADEKDYQFISASELAKDGISPFEIFNLCKDDEDPEKLWLFFEVTASFSDSIEYGGKTVPATIFRGLQFIGELDSRDFKITKYYYIHTGPDVFPYPIHGALKIKDSFFTRHVPAVIDKQVVSIMKANDSLYTLNRLLMPGDSTSIYMKTKFVTELRFDRKPDGKMLIANSIQLYDDQQRQILEIYNEETNRHIMAFKYNDLDSSIYYYINEKQNEIKTSHLYRYHPERGKEWLLEFEKWGPALFIPEKAEMVRLVKTDSHACLHTYRLPEFLNHQNF